MASKQLNRYAEMVVVCSGDERYGGGELTYEEHILVSVLAGELRVVQAERPLGCAAGDAVLLPRKQPATIKVPKDGAAYQAVSPFNVNAVCPGYTKTDFTGHQGTSMAEEAA